MKYAVFTVSLPEWTPEQAVKELREAGYDGVEWRVVDQQPADPPGFWAGNHCTWPQSSIVEDAPRMRSITEAAGLVIPSLGTYVSCENPGAVELAMRGAALAGARQLRVGVPTYKGTEPYLPLRERAREQYREVERLARVHGVRALIEIHMGNITPSASAAAAFLDGFDPALVGVIHDAGNMVYEGYEQYRMGLEILGPYLGHVHLKSASWQTVGTRADGGPEWRAGWAELRKGIVDLHALISALRAVGYDGWLSFEDFTTDRPLRERLHDNLAFVKGIVAEVG
jgi:sugar phosphate isomerase/epimerase